MSNVDGLSLTYAVLCMVLVGSALVARRLPLGQTAKMAAAWVGIFAVVFGIFAFRSEFMAIGQRMKSELLGTPIVQGEEIRIPIAEDGHFWTTATVNGREARFLVDTGATSTVIAAELASELGLPQDEQQQVVDTANGSVLMGMTRVDLNVVGIERPQMRVLVNPADSSNVLGMNFLSSLSSWRVEGQHLVLQP